MDYVKIFISISKLAVKRLNGLNLLCLKQLM
jgi:hypothetical protein